MVLLILVAHGEAGDPTTLGAARAARELMADELDVRVREVELPLSDEQAIELGKTAGANAVAEVSWESSEHRAARVHLHVEPRPGWNDRTITFSAGDDFAERGRTVGFAVASMLPGLSSRSSTSAVPVNPAPVDADAKVPRTWVRETPPDHGGFGAIDVVGAVAMGVGGEATGWGGAASGRWYFHPRFAFRAGFSARSGQLAVAEATSLQVHLAAGLAWMAVPSAPRRPFEIGARLSLLAMRDQLWHFDADDPEPVPAGRWLPGAEWALEGAWLFGPSAGLVMATGAEVAFGRTDVTTKNRWVATIPPVRLVIQLGIRANF